MFYTRHHLSPSQRIPFLGVVVTNVCKAHRFLGPVKKNQQAISLVGFEPTTFAILEQTSCL